MPKTYTYPGRWARYEAAAVYAIAMLFVFGHLVFADQLFPDQEDQRKQITEEVSQNG